MTLNLSEIFDRSLAMAAFGAYQLTTYNHQELTIDDIRESLQLSPLVGYALRQGRDAVPQDDEVEASLDFLTQSLRLVLDSETIPELTITKDDQGAYLECNIPDASNFKWFRNKYPDGAAEWEPLPKSPNASLLPITLSTRLHLIRCDFVLQGTGYSVYTGWPINHAENTICLPFSVDPKIAGSPLEGTMMSVLPLDIPVRIAWICDSKVLASDQQSYSVTAAEIGHCIELVLVPYCDSFPSLTFERIYMATDPVAALIPSVSGVTFPEIMMEGDEITFTRVLIPDREGDSLIYLERAENQAAEWIKCADLTADKFAYTPTGADVNNYLRLVYQPVTPEGTAGETICFYSKTKIYPKTPTFTNPIIAGVPKTNYTLCALADYAGGIEGEHSYEWYFSRSPITKIPKKTKIVGTEQFFTPPSNMANGYLAVAMVPVRKDDVVGDPVFAAIQSPLELCDPPKPLEVPDELTVGHQVKFPHQVDFLLSSTTGYFGFDVVKTSTSFTPREKHLGKILKVATDDCEVVVGKIGPAIPIVLDASITAPQWQAGTVASFQIKHKHASPDKIEILWTHLMNGRDIPVAINTPQYTISDSDIGYALRIIVTAFDANGRRMTPFISKASPIIRDTSLNEPIIVGMLMEGEMVQVDCPTEITSFSWQRSAREGKYVEFDTKEIALLGPKEVGKNIRCVVKLADGKTLKTTSKSTVESAPPSAEVTLAANVVEGVAIKPEIEYHGGKEGQSIYQWQRETDQQWEDIATTRDYTPQSQDTDHILRFIYTPIRSDGYVGDSIQCECGPVEAIPPTVKNVMVGQNSDGKLEVSGDYCGGEEGPSFIVWRYYEDGKATILGKWHKVPLDVRADLVGFEIDAAYVPVRKDGTMGQPVNSSNKWKVQPLPQVESVTLLAKGGSYVEGSVLRVKATGTGNKLVYQWQRSYDGGLPEDIPGATQIEYKPVHDDVGYQIGCCVWAINPAGWRSDPEVVLSEGEVGEAEGMLRVIGEPETGVDLDSTFKGRVAWEREETDGWKEITRSPKYRVSIADVGHRLRCRKSGVTSEETAVVSLNKKIESLIKVNAKSRAFTFEGLSKAGNMVYRFTASKTGLQMISKAGKKSGKWNNIKIEGVENTEDELRIWLDPSSKYQLKASLENDARLESNVGPENIRDFVIGVLQIIATTA